MANTTYLLGILQLYILIFILSIFPKTILSSDPETLSIVLDHKRSADQEFVQILNPPKYIDSTTLLRVEYRCSRNNVVGVAVVLRFADHDTTKTYQRLWKCSGKNNQNKIRKIRIRLPDSVSFRPDFFNRAVTLVSSAKLRAWIASDAQTKTVQKEDVYQKEGIEVTVVFSDKLRASIDSDDQTKTVQLKEDVYQRAEIKVQYETHIRDVYSRKSRTPWRACKSWYWQTMSNMPFINKEICQTEQEKIQMVSYPAALNGRHYGIYRSFSGFNDPILEDQRKKSINKPILTISMWLYILEYCPYSKSKRTIRYCTLMMHGSMNKALTPAIVVLSDGSFQLEVRFTDEQHVAMKPAFKLPKHQWFRLILNMQYRTWKITINYGQEWNETRVTEFTYDHDVKMDDTEGFFVFGGNDYSMHTTLGYIGETVLYRGRWVPPKQIPYPSQYDPMFQLGLNHREEKCRSFITWINNRVAFYTRKINNSHRTDVCNDYFYKMLKPSSNKNPPKTCSTERRRPARRYQIVNNYIRKSVLQRQLVSHNNMSTVALYLYNNATDLIDHDLSNIPVAVPLLKQSSCLGNTNAMYMLAVILNNGIYFKSDEIQAQAYLMMASLEGHRLATMALGNKHIIGTDGVPYDREHSYLYYKYVADKTREDMEAHKTSNVLTESVRLTDETLLKQQTDEDGDMFNWLKHQAQSGVLSAQKNLGRTLFWGANGLKRNVEAAVNYIRAGAEQQDPEAMFDYGILLYKGYGDVKNETEGKQIVEKAASKMNPSAINALGWIALEKERNYTKAADLFQVSYKKGMADSGYYLGFMYMHGMVPKEPVNLIKARDYFAWAAARGHLDAGIWFAYINMKGAPEIARDSFRASEWGRYIAEKNPALGFLLRKALHSWRKADMPNAIFYYLMAAEAGSEIGAFNSAYLCEDNKEGITNYIEKECQWRNFNISLQREPHNINAYSLIKMGDYYWYGCQGDRDVNKAAIYYSQSARKGDPHAVFNLGMMIEEGEKIPSAILSSIGVRHDLDNVTMLTTLYTRCKESRRTEAYIPCTLALYRVQLLDLWTRYHLWMKLSSIVGVAVFTTSTMYILYHHLRYRPPPQDTV